MLDNPPTVNGHAKGRRVPPLPSFTFPDSGITIQVRRLSPYVGDDIRRALLKERPKPTAPLIAVEDGDNGKTRLEPNPADPGYHQRVVDHEAWLAETAGERLLQIMATYAAICDPDLDAVAAVRAMLPATGIDPATLAALPDTVLYVRYVCISTPRDLTAFQQFVMGQSQPTEEAVQAHLDTFRGDLPGA